MSAQFTEERPSIPLWLDQRRAQMRWEVYNGAAVFDYPRVLLPDEIDDLEEVLELVIRGLRRTASAIEAASADETENTGSTEGESATVEDGDAQNTDLSGDHP